MKIKPFLFFYIFLFYACDKNPSVSDDSSLPNIDACDNSQFEFICWDDSIQCSYADCPDYFNVQINETGESTLFIFKDTISTLEFGDEIAIYDQQGLINSEGGMGSILVGSGVWTNEQLEIPAIMGLDLVAFGGMILPGAIQGNSLKIKIWDKSSQTVKENVIYNADNISIATFNGMFTAISELIIQE